MRRDRAAGLLPVACTGPPSGPPAAALRPLLGERGGLPACRPALRRQLLLQMLDVAFQAVDVTFQAVNVTLQAVVVASQAVVVAFQAVVVALHFLATRLVLLLDAPAPPTPLTSRGLLAVKHAAQQAHAPFIGAAYQICTQLRRFSCYDPLNEDLWRRPNLPFRPIRKFQKRHPSQPTSPHPDLLPHTPQQTNPVSLSRAVPHSADAPPSVAPLPSRSSGPPSPISHLPPRTPQPKELI